MIYRGLFCEQFVAETETQLIRFLPESIDAYDVRSLRCQIGTFLEAAPVCTNLIISLGHCNRVDSSVIGLVLSIGKRFAATGAQKLIIVSPNILIQSLLITCKLDNLFELVESERSAFGVVSHTSQVVQHS